jgi:hypothetical protein
MAKHSQGQVIIAHAAAAKGTASIRVGARLARWESLALRPIVCADRTRIVQCG